MAVICTVITPVIASIVKMVEFALEIRPYCHIVSALKVRRSEMGLLKNNLIDFFIPRMKWRMIFFFKIISSLFVFFFIGWI